MSRVPGFPSSFFLDWADQNDRRPASDPHVDTSTKTPNQRLRRGLALGMVAASATAVSLLLTGPTATADPAANVWYRLRMCESSNNYQINTGNGYYGAYQFDLATWRSVGGSGYPNQAPAAEQDARALMLYRLRGWQPWTCASILGLREDSDARSGRTGDINVGSAPVAQPVGAKPVGSGPAAIPAFPGTRWYHYGDWNSDIKTFQDEMHRRGFFPVGTGQYGPNTARMVKQLQQLNGLIPNGFIGPNTWRLAWTGRYTPPATPPASVPAAKPVAPKPVAPTPVHRSSAVPAFPGDAWYRYGDWNSHIKAFQDEMHRRGFFPVGTGQYGPNTARMVKQLQRLNGLIPNGFIGPKTWQLAWTGKYTPPAS